MTIHELSQLYQLNREIEADRQRLTELEAAATSTSANITGMPHGTGVSNKTAIAADIADIRSEIFRKLDRVSAEYRRLQYRRRR
ncbi:MAG: hypothetical protein HFE63_01070 [Clostridiales bacterium]|nr:hypothetical protein [Clostridiales bacterium]